VKSIFALLEDSIEYGVAHGQLMSVKDSLSKTRYGKSVLKMLEERSVSDMCAVSVSAKHLQREPTQRMSWADMSEDTDDDC